MRNRVRPFWGTATVGTAVLCLTLTACYTPDQSELEKEIRHLVSVGMPTSTATANLKADGFACSGDSPIFCGRTQQRLLPSSCAERVFLVSDKTTLMIVSFDVPPIPCTGF